jgi:signal transduction histidine kinase
VATRGFGVERNARGAAHRLPFAGAVVFLLGRLLGYMAAGFVLAWGCGFADSNGAYVFWPFTGILAGALTIARRSDILWMALAACSGRLLAGLAVLPLADAVVFTALDIPELVIWTWGLRRWRCASGEDCLEETAARAAVLIVGAIPSAVLYALWMQTTTGAPFLREVLNWWGADVLGGFVGAPLVLAWGRARRARPTGLWRPTGGARPPATVAIFAGALAFLPWFGLLDVEHNWSYVLLAILTWSAIRFQPVIAVTTSADAAVAATWVHLQPGDHVDHLLSTQIFIGVVSVSSLILAVVVEQQRRTTAKLRESQQQLRALGARAEAVREEERARISREVHDVVGQGLTALKLELTAMGGAAAVMPLVDETLAAARRLASDLRPPTLDHFGIVAALDEYVTQLARRSGLACRTSLGSGVTTLEDDCALAVFRATQEALTNVVRHARATAVSVDVFEDAEQFAVEITDDGVGMPEAKGAGLGIPGMRERLLPFGGRLSFHRRDSGGTVVTISVPVRTPVLAAA